MKFKVKKTSDEIWDDTIKHDDVEISSIEELIAFVKIHGRIIISESIWKDGEYEIEIYDDYRE